VTALPARPVWRALLGEYPNTRALRLGELSSSSVQLDFADVTVPNRAFKRVVRELEFDVAELALITFLMARACGKPLVLLPITLFSRNPLPYLVCNSARAQIDPRDLGGRLVGVRSYTTTTATWIRGILEDEYGIGSPRVRWLTLEDAHVAEFIDPPNVLRAQGADLRRVLLAGEIDAAIVDPVPADPGISSVVSDPARVFADWRRSRHATPLNHVVVVKESLTLSQPEAVRDTFRLLVESRSLAGTAVEMESIPVGLEAMRSSLQVAIEYAQGQHLLARKLTVDELVNDVTSALTGQ